MKYQLENRSAAHLLGAAIKELFPGVALGGGALEDYGFFYRFVYPKELPQEFLSLLEEKMRGLQKEISFKKQEMVPSNAAAFLSVKGEPVLADKAHLMKGPLISILIAGDYVDIDLGIFPQKKELAFSLLKMERDEESIVIYGVARANLGDLKTFIKNWKKRAKILEDLGEEFLLYKGAPLLLSQKKEELHQLYYQAKTWRAPARPIISPFRGDERVSLLLNCEQRRGPSRFHWSDEEGDLALFFTQKEGLVEAQKKLFQERVAIETVPLEWIFEKKGRRVCIEGEKSQLDSFDELFHSKKAASIQIYMVDQLGKEWLISSIVNSGYGYILSSFFINPFEYLFAKKISLALPAEPIAKLHLGPNSRF